MKRSTKIALAVAAALLVGGAVLCTISLSRVNYDFGALTTAQAPEHRVETVRAAGVETIQMELDADDVHIVRSEDDQIHVSWYDREERRYELTRDDGALILQQVQQTGKRDWRRWISFDWDTGTTGVELAVPADFDGDLHVWVDLGALSVDGVSMTGELECRTDSGAVEINRLDAGSVVAESSLGKIRGSDWSVARGVSVTTDSGGISLQRCKASEFQLGAQLGSIGLGQVAAGTVHAETDSGSIDLDALRADEITLKTDLGRVSGSIDGVQTQYTVFPEARLGNNNLTGRKGSADKTLTVTTESGDIDLSFLH